MQILARIYNWMKPLAFIVALLGGESTSFGLDFFKVNSVKYLAREPKDEVGVWLFEPKGPKRLLTPTKFLPCLEVKVETAENIYSKDLYARAHFFDETGKLLATQPNPTKAGPRKGFQEEIPPFLHKKKPAIIYFQIPDSVKDKKWTSVVVFGDKKDADALCYPAHEWYLKFDFPEKKLAQSRVSHKRNPAIDPLVEHVVKTRNPKQPQITLFLRPPKGVSDAKEIKGVLAICILAGGIDGLRNTLRQEELPGDHNGLYEFANRHKLVIIAWGARRGFWNAGLNHDDYAKRDARETDKQFGFVADAWEQGVNELSERYGFPPRNFLLWGQSGAAQWVKRLCLRKPDFFLAVHAHIASSFDKPTPEAAKVLWCITTGELESGWERSLRFVTQCRDLGYPIVYKAIPGLGHSGHPQTTRLGFAFFEYALTLREARAEYDAGQKGASSRLQTLNSGPPTPWIDEFKEPPFYADIVNQEVYPTDKLDLIPAGFRIALPTKEIKKVWNNE